LDKIYIKPDEENIFYLDCTRIDQTNDVTARRKESLEDQIKRISRTVPIKEIALADDVVFSGSVLRKIIGLFKNQGVEVVKILSCISTQQGYDFFNKTLQDGLETCYLLGEDVIDQICERDFYFGIAGSGILVKTKEGLMKAPYFLPFGNPNERASIPKDKVTSFSKGCIERSILLWDAIDSLKEEKTKMRDLPERIVGTKENEEVVKVLKKEGKKL